MNTKTSFDTPTININGQELKVRFTMRATREYEEITGKSLSQADGTWDEIIYFWCTLRALNKDFKMEFEDFVDYLDENIEVFIEFQKSQQQTNPEPGPEASGRNPEPDKKKTNYFGLWTLSLLLLVSPVLVPLISGIALLYLSLRLLVSLIAKAGKKLASPFSRSAAPSPSRGTASSQRPAASSQRPAANTPRNNAPTSPKHSPTT